MKEQPLRTSVIGSYPLPGWLEHVGRNLSAFGAEDIKEAQDDAVVAAVHDQVRAGLDVITDGEQTRLDFNLSFYGCLEGISVEPAPPRIFGPPAHDQRGKHAVTGELRAPRGLGAVAEFERLKRLAPPGPAFKASVPGPYTLSGRLLPCERYPDRWALTQALLPIVQRELEALIAAGCREICVDEPSMSCYAYREDPKRFVRIFNETVEPVVGRTRLCTHLCFGNYKGRSVGRRTVAPMFPAFLDFKVDEMHLEMATTVFKEIEFVEPITKRMDAAIGVIDVKGYYIETPEEIAERVRLALKYAPADRLVFAPDCGLSQTARWAARLKLQNMVEGVAIVRKELGIAS
jgi:5-methyltetrahydropteroyltriglutamate--homocysteine methyltransferase